MHLFFRVGGGDICLAVPCPHIARAFSCHTCTMQALRGFVKPGGVVKVASNSNATGRCMFRHVLLRLSSLPCALNDRDLLLSGVRLLASCLQPRSPKIVS